MLIIETALVIAAIILAFVLPRLGERWIAPWEQRFARFARRRQLSVLAVGLAALGLRLLLLPVLPIPEPAVHDEYSYLLAADTFAHGRLANPTHPLWMHFETFHVNQKPTYVSMYYPAQGLFLAFGQVIFGHPFWGVCLSTALMCATVCWMLQGWFPPLWALLGGLLSVIRLGTFSYWMNSYWGGSVSALGGALVLGALPRVKRTRRIRDALLMGLGFAIIANSRPYEGLFFSFPVFVNLWLWIRCAKSSPHRAILGNFIVPLAVVFALTLGGMGYYFWRTTGNPLETPYVVNVRTYFSVPAFPWLPVKAPPVYNHAIMQNFYQGWIAQEYELSRHHPLLVIFVRTCMLWFFFLGPLLTLPLFALCFVLPYGISFRDLKPAAKLFLGVCGVVFLGAMLPIGLDPHYIAPVTCAFYALILMAMQQTRHWRPDGRPIGIALVRVVLIVAVLLFAIRTVIPSTGKEETFLKLATWYAPVIVNTYRARIISRLNATPEPDLVIVRYGPDHISNDEWVYDAADIDHSKIVWARDMGEPKNSELIEYFKNRKVWMVEPDIIPPRLTPYESRHLADFSSPKGRR